MFFILIFQLNFLERRKVLYVSEDRCKKTEKQLEPIKCQCCPLIETIQLICNPFNGLIQ